MPFFRDKTIIDPVPLLSGSMVNDSRSFVLVKLCDSLPLQRAVGSSTMIRRSSLSRSMEKFTFLFVSMTIRTLSACSPARRFVAIVPS